jgi:hypothetical protein
MLPVTLAWVPTPLLAWTTNGVEAALILGCALPAVATAAARLRVFRNAEQPPDILNWATFGFSASAVIATLALSLGLSPGDTASLVALVGMMSTGAAAFVVHPRLLSPALAYGAVVVIQLADPHSWPATLVVATLLLAAALGMGAGGRFEAR